MVDSFYDYLPVDFSRFSFIKNLETQNKPLTGFVS